MSLCILAPSITRIEDLRKLAELRLHGRAIKTYAGIVGLDDLESFERPSHLILIGSSSIHGLAQMAMEDSDANWMIVLRPEFSYQATFLEDVSRAADRYPRADLLLGLVQTSLPPVLQIARSLLPAQYWIRKGARVLQVWNRDTYSRFWPHQETDASGEDLIRFAEEQEIRWEGFSLTRAVWRN